jgi:hypothetical protein
MKDNQMDSKRSVCDQIKPILQIKFDGSRGDDEREQML